jgi:GTP-binding protein
MTSHSVSLENARYLMSETDPKKLGPCLAEIAFVGRSNVGKSSLLNALCRKDLARVSGTPGRTRAINIFLIGKDCWLVDLPGYGFARGPKQERESWEAMIENYLTKRPNLRMVFALIDAEVGPTKLDFQMQVWLTANGLPWRAVATKADQVPPSKSVQQRRNIAQDLNLPPEGLAWVSAKKNIGVQELRAEAVRLLSIG